MSSLRVVRLKLQYLLMFVRIVMVRDGMNVAVVPVASSLGEVRGELTR